MLLLILIGNGPIHVSCCSCKKNILSKVINNELNSLNSDFIIQKK